ncbi:MAG TPA: S41 family peptidase [Planctomycetota bacterium]
MRTLAVLAIAVFVLPGAGPEAGGDVRKAKAYLSEVRKHLLRSYLERERMSEVGLAAAALKAFAKALKEVDLPEDQREAARAALGNEETADGALEAIARAAPAADVNALADRAAEAMVRETGDPFCRILTQDEMTRLVKMIGGGGKEVTAGVMVQPRADGLAVMYVQACTPADEEGVEVGDLVTRAGDRAVGGLSPDEAIEALKIPPGGALELTVTRGGRDYAFRLRAPKAGVPTVRWQSLGQGVGYVRLTLFDGAALKDVRAALQALAKDGLKGLIFDLRRNPGGALPAATGIADLFLPQDLLIARTVCHYTPSLGGLKFPGLTPPAEYKTRQATDFETMPMVCLVDGGSASASELLAGALKDHRRATLVGGKTYGKGVGQSPIVLSSMFLQRYLYLTVLRYSTPLGHEVDHVGVAPDVEARAAALDADAWDARWKLRRDGALERWLDGRWGPKLAKAAEYDGFETAAWEGFDGLYAGLGTALSKDVVREELRRAARRRAMEEGAAWACDPQADVVLQRGLVVLLDRMEGK